MPVGYKVPPRQAGAATFLASVENRGYRYLLPVEINGKDRFPDSYHRGIDEIAGFWVVALGDLPDEFVGLIPQRLEEVGVFLRELPHLFRLHAHRASSGCAGFHTTKLLLTP